ncbi:hypothetical protein CHS0354_021698 [Potamilus streckersoni]|uniref:TIR domain-containing protein n=1 Tax=Potamilus streckersoni TaxID=2493646 RepID=A0AAE0TMJ6_9BIVA|nr:hypothetical protein CHS0354_021698 [Potamilus streckersoni]
MKISQMDLYHLLCILILCLSRTDVKEYPDACDLCKCTLNSFHQWHVDCSRKGLNSSMVPTIYPNLTISLILSHNPIGALSNSPFSELHSLKILNISYANLLRVEKEAFDGLYNLEILDISHNLLVISNRSVPVRLVRDLTSLKVLKISYNVKDTKRTDISYPDEAMGQVKSLQTLYMDGLINSTFGPGFRNLTNLTTIIFSGEENVGYCGLKTISSEMFKNVPYLTELIIQKCGVEHIEEQTFSPLSHLDLLDLSGNKKLGIERAALGFLGLKNTSIRVLKLNNIYSDFSIGVRIKKKYIEMLRNTSITEMELSGNGIELVDGETFEVMPVNITKLNVSRNRFLMGDYLLHACLLKNLTILDGSYQFFSPLGTDDVTKGYISSLEDTSRLTMMNEINLTIQIPENLKVANFSHSKLVFPILNYGVSKNNLDYLDASYSMLYKWTGPVLGFDKLTYLDLSNNLCSELSFTFFHYFPRLVTLLVSNNLLGIVIARDQDGQIFQNLTTLQRLDLSNNRITYLDKKLFRGLVSINILNISHNLLDTFIVNIGHMKNLNVLDLSQNMLQVVRYPVRIALENIASVTTEKVYVNISHNQLHCMCSTSNFMIWVRDTKTNVVGMSSCILANGTKVVSNYTIDLLRYIDSLEKECMSKIGLIFGTTVSISLAVLIVVVGIVYRYRWKLRYIYYMAMNRSKGYHPIGNFDTDNDFVYDAFVSFADEDREFVRDFILMELEHKRGMHLCVSFRDFVPGREIASNIIEAIHNSRKTVMLLTENFLLSKWCVYEFQMAYQESIHNGRDTFIVILYEDIPTERIYRVINMRNVFQSNSYIEYPRISRMDGNEQTLDMFWDRCTQAIKESGCCKNKQTLRDFHMIGTTF